MPEVKFKDYSLYLIISREYALGKGALEALKSAISGGVDIVQMREKKMPSDELVCLGKQFFELCRNKKVIFIVNNDPFIAKEVDADGVHMGQEDIAAFPIAQVRKSIGLNKIIGVSTHSLEEFERANEDDVDYIAFGPIFPTETKDYCIGTKHIKDVLKIAKKPVFFVGGINLSNINVVLKEGAKNIALIRAILQAKDITAQTACFKQKLTGAGEG